MNQVHIASVRTVSLLSVVEDKIRAEPRVFTEFVKILESEPTLRSQANELVKLYRHGTYWPKLFILGSYIFVSGSDIGQARNAPATTSSAISRYGDYLEGVYSRSSVSSDGKFPPTPSKTYVSLAVVERASQIRDIEQVRKNTLHGRVDKLLEGKIKIEITDILKPQDNDKPVTLVFVEGPPGIGKSTLAWELCRRWDRKQYDLAVLLRLREREVQQIENIADLFPHGNKQLQQLVTEEVLDREGKGVIFILDGYDELPIKLRCEGLLVQLLKGEVLPNCSVLVTSRPSATSDLLMACSPQIQRHVEILGFTQECVIDYASSVFISEPEVLKDFLTYISASQNPAINSLMYIPLNAAIIVHIYRNSRRKGCPIPKTLTQVYTQLCLTLLQRYLESIDPQDRTILNKFSDLPSTYYGNFKQLAQLAFEQFEKHNVVFYSQDVPKELVHFGFLDSVSSLYGGGGVSYNFLHLTLQEFLVAYHITQLSNGIDVFKRHSEDRRWEVVWRFVSGLTGFQYFMDSVRCDTFASVSEDDDYLEVKTLLLHCLFEGQFVLDYMAVMGCNKLHFNQDYDYSSPLDRYALGYCIANCSSRTTVMWKVEMQLGSGESFMWGLNSNHCGNGVTISHLQMELVFPTCLDSYPMTVLSGIKHLSVEYLTHKDETLLKVLPKMKNLTSLGFDFPSPQIVKSLFHAISQSNVTQLEFNIEVFNQTYLSSLNGLIDSPSKLKDLRIIVLRFDYHGASESVRRSGMPTLSDNFIDPAGSDVNTKPLCDVLFGPSSLNQLTLDLPHFTENSFDLLETNTCLTTVDISSNKDLPLKPLFRILERNKTVESLGWNSHMLERPWNKELETLHNSLSSNTTLKKLTMEIYACENRCHLIHDSRVELIVRVCSLFDSELLVEM